MLVGYARISSQDQNLGLQRDALTKAVAAAREAVAEQDMAAAGLALMQLPQSVRPGELHRHDDENDYKYKLLLRRGRALLCSSASCAKLGGMRVVDHRWPWVALVQLLDRG